MGLTLKSKDVGDIVGTSFGPPLARRLLLRAAAVGLAGVTVAGLLQSPAAAESPVPAGLPTDVKAPPTAVQQLEAKVDAEVNKFLTGSRVPGLTVAISKGNKLILTKGYGQARAAGGPVLPMRADTRSRVGSSTKAVMTGPATWELLKADPTVSSQTKLYGPDGFFTGKFDPDIDIALANLYATATYKPTLADYRKITIQNLFDHMAGFIRNGDLEGAVEMFGGEVKDITYAQAHQYFLQTKPLQYEPGTTGGLDEGGRYSNHGFGLMTLVVEQLSGKSFLDYTRDNYLKPMGLHSSVRGEWDNPDSCDAFNHIYSDTGAWNLMPFEQTRQGLAAGGLRSSAQDLVRIMQNLNTRYPTTAELDAMGWRVASDGRIAHDGDIDGGNSYMNMYKGNYSDPDLRNVNIAVVANIKVDTRAVNMAIANHVANTTIPETDYDLWPQALATRHCEYVRQSVPAAGFQSMLDEAIRHGYRLEWVDAVEYWGGASFNAVFRAKGPTIAWATHVEMLEASFASKRASYRSAGYTMAHVDSYVVNDTVRYAAIWTKGPPDETSYLGHTTAQHQSAYNLNVSKGWTPKVISVAVVKGTPYFTAIYTKEPAGSIFAKAGMTNASYQTYVTEQKDAGRKLRYLNAYPEKGEIRFSAIWTSEPKTGLQPTAHGLSGAEMRNAWLMNRSAGYETKGVTAYYVGNLNLAYSAFWI